MPLSLSSYCGTCWYLQSCIGRTLILHLKIELKNVIMVQPFISFWLHLEASWSDFGRIVVKSALECLIL